MARFKTKFCWLPVRLVRHRENPKEDEPKLEFIGWTWLVKAPLTKNITHGWIYVLDDKSHQYKCPTCKQVVTL